MNRDIDFNNLLLQSILNHSTNPETDSDLFNDYGYNVTLGNYTHNFEICFPSMNEDIYPNVNIESSPQIGTILYNLNTNLDFPVFNSLNSTFSNVDHISLDVAPIILVSANIRNATNDSTINYIHAMSGAGRCKESKTTGWCNNKGRGCKCQGGPIETVDLIELFISTIN